MRIRYILGNLAGIVVFLAVFGSGVGAFGFALGAGLALAWRLVGAP